MNCLLAIETTGLQLGISIYAIDRNRKIGKRILTHYSEAAHRQSDLLFPMLDRLMKKKKLKPTDLHFIVVDIGPGSFTGVRVGVSSARALAQGLQIDLLGVTSLEAMAYAKFKNQRTPDGWVAPSLFALEGEVYGAVYSYEAGELTSVLNPRWCPNKDFAQSLAKLKSARQRPMIESTQTPPHPEDLAELALQKIFKSEKSIRFDYNKVVPLYLQPSWAERKKTSWNLV